MRRAIARTLVRLYPRAWRERYGEEFAVLLEERRDGVGATLNVIGSAMRERIFPTVGGAMEQEIYSFGAIARKPSAYVPLAMSLASLAMLLVAMAYGLMIGQPLGAKGMSLRVANAGKSVYVTDRGTVQEYRVNTDGTLASNPTVHREDEGSMAHIFQLLMTSQIPVALFFAAKWLRRAPRQTLGVLSLQVVAWLAACAPVYLLHL